MRALVAGAEGQLGRALVDRLGSVVVLAASRAALDVADAAAVDRAVRSCGADVVLNAAAYNKVDAAESDVLAALAVNAAGAHHLARAARAAGARMVHVSTDYVFDGGTTDAYRESDRPRPLGAYGASKLSGELLVQAADDTALVVRTSAVLGRGASRAKGGSFVERIVERARSGAPVRVVTDQVFSPTGAVDLAEAICALLDARATGLVHVANAGSCSWHELACEALTLAGLNVPVERIRSSDLGLAARRPARSVLATDRYAELTGRTMRPWQVALGDVLAP